MGKKSRDLEGRCPGLPSLDKPIPGLPVVPSNQRDITLGDPSHKWVINLSNKSLTQAQRSLLAKGPIYAISSQAPPNLEYITAIESVCTKLNQQDGKGT